MKQKTINGIPTWIFPKFNSQNEHEGGQLMDDHLKESDMVIQVHLPSTKVSDTDMADAIENVELLQKTPKFIHVYHQDDKSVISFYVTNKITNKKKTK